MSDRPRPKKVNVTTSKPLISVVVPVKNEASHIIATLQSIAENTYPNIEIVVIDDGSVDGSRDLVTKYAAKLRTLKKSRIERFGYITRKYNSPSHAVAAGIKHSSGEIVLVLPADVRLEKRALENLHIRYGNADIKSVFTRPIYQETDKRSTVCRILAAYDQPIVSFRKQALDYDKLQAMPLKAFADSLQPVYAQNVIGYTDVTFDVHDVLARFSRVRKKLASAPAGLTHRA